MSILNWSVATFPSAVPLGWQRSGSSWGFGNHACCCRCTDSIQEVNVEGQSRGGLCPLTSLLLLAAVGEGVSMVPTILTHDQVVLVPVATGNGSGKFSGSCSRPYADTSPHSMTGLKKGYESYEPMTSASASPEDGELDHSPQIQFMGQMFNSPVLMVRSRSYGH